MPRPQARTGAGSLSASTAASTRSRLSSGSPIPMNTMFGQPLAVGGQAPRGMADLVDDLGGLEVAPEPELAGRAERAADRAAGLARDAQRVPLTAPGACRVVHQDRFDERAVVEPVERLLGQAAVGDPQLGVGRRCRGGRSRRAPRGARRGASRSSAGSVVPPARPDARRRPGERGTAARPGRRPTPRARPGSRPRGRDDPRGSRVDASAARSADRSPRCRRARAGHAGYASQDIGRPPAGWTCARPSRPSAVARPSAVRVPGASRRPARAGRRDGRRQTASRPSPVSMNVPGQGRRPGPAARARGRLARVEPAVLAAERPGHLAAASSCGGLDRAPESQSGSVRQQVGAATSRASPRARARARCRRAASRLRRRSAQCRDPRPSA